MLQWSQAQGLHVLCWNRRWRGQMLYRRMCLVVRRSNPERWMPQSLGTTAAALRFDLASVPLVDASAIFRHASTRTSERVTLGAHSPDAASLDCLVNLSR